MDRRTTIWSLLLCIAGTALSEGKDTIEIFNDKGDTFVRAGSKQGLKVGTTVTIVGDKIADTAERRSVGTASVLEVWPNLARVSLDKGAQSAQGEKFAKVVPRPAAPRQVAAAEPPAVVPKAALKGRAEKNALGRISLFNDSNTEWTECELTLPDKSHYSLSHLAAQGFDTVMSIKFSRDPDPPLNSVAMRCDEGQTSFEFANPSLPGALRGHVEHASMSRIVVYNDSNAAWNRCSARLPGGAQYTVGRLDARDHVRVAQSDFKKEDILMNSVTVRCKQGESKFTFK